MKKKLLSLMLVFAMMLSLVGCTPNMQAFLKANQELESWKGYRIDGKFNTELTMNLPEMEGKEAAAPKSVHVAIPMTMKGTGEGKDKIAMEMNMDFSAMKKAFSNAAKADGSEKELQALGDNMKINMVMDGTNVYMGKDYLAAISPKAKEIKEEYIQLPNDMPAAGTTLSPEAMKYLQSQEFQADFFDLLNTALPNFKPAQDVKVEGNTYSYQVTTDELLADLGKGMDTVVTNWSAIAPKIEKITNKMGLKVTAEQLKEMVKAHNKEEVAKGLEEAKQMLKGSSLSYKETIDKDKISADMNMDIKIAKMGEMKLTGTSTYVKDETAKVTIPTSVKKMTQEEFMKLILGDIESMVVVRINGEPVEFEDQQPIIKDDRTLIPFRGVLEKMGAKVEWDQKAQTVTSMKDNQKVVLKIQDKNANVNGKTVVLDVPAQIVKDRTMVPARFLAENFGYKVKYEKQNGFMNIVDIYQGTEEELQKKIEGYQKKQMEEFNKLMKADAEKGAQTAAPQAQAK